MNQKNSRSDVVDGVMARIGRNALVMMVAGSVGIPATRARAEHARVMDVRTIGVDVTRTRITTVTDTLRQIKVSGHTIIVPPPVSREFRAVWVSPVGGGGNTDWPSRPGMPMVEQQAELRTLLDRAKAIGLNAVILHVRPAADALYASATEPWSAFLTGVSGQNPGYDPLAFAIQEAHARGLQLHAWFNPFRAVFPGFTGRLAANHVTHTHPEWIRKYGEQTWIDPGDPNARRAILAIILDVVRRYDVDGVHIDDYFYPYRESETIVKRVHRHRVSTRRDIPFPDDRTWERYGKAAGWTNRADWRRANVNDFVRSMYQEVKAEKPWVLVGISPFGIWKSGVPAGVTGLDAYGEIYADSRLWLTQGWMDYIAPQLYWPLDGAEHRFVELDHWWREAAQNPKGRHVWPGLATFLARRWPAHELSTQINTLRDDRLGTNDVPGHVHFRMSALTQDDGSLGNDLDQTVYTEPALVPAFPWLGDTTPAAPKITPAPGTPLHVRKYVTTPGNKVPVTWWLVQRRQKDGTWTTALYRAQAGVPYTFDVPEKETVYGTVAVRAIGRSGLESGMTVLSW